MKRIQLFVLLIFGLLISCVQNDDYNTPDITIFDPEIDANDILQIKALHDQYAQTINDGDSFYTYTDEKYIEGYIISSDEGGNFFEELILQDKAENPQYGIKFLIDVNPLFTTFEFGRRVYINLKGLSIGISNGVLTLGTLNADEIDKVSSFLIEETLLPTSLKAEITPLETSISEIGESHENLYIRLSDIQFHRSNLIPDILTFAGEEADEFDGERQLEDCTDNSRLILSTSTFSDFKSSQIPAGRGTIDGVLTRDFFDDFYTLIINSPEDILFEDEERCDPDFLECPPVSEGNTEVYKEDFEAFGTLPNEGWTNTNISNGETLWEIGSFRTNSYAEISGFRTDEAEINVWLVSPAINLDSSTEESLTFDVQTNFNNANILSVWVSTNFNGNPETATWQALDVAIPIGNSSGFGDFENVGTVSLSCLSGDIHIGFLYNGSDPDATTRYHVDNLTILEVE